MWKVTQVFKFTFVVLLLLVSACADKRLPSGESVDKVFPDKNALNIVKSAIAGKQDSLAVAIRNAGFVDPRGAYGITPLWWTVWVSDFTAFRLLVQSGAKGDINNERFPNIIELAAMNADERFLQLLIRSGTDLNIVNPRTGETPIFSALMNLQLANLRTLLAASARTDVKDSEGNDLILRAAQLNRYDVVYELLTSRRAELVKNNYGTGLSELIARSKIDPSNPLAEWKKKVELSLKKRTEPHKPTKAL